MMNHVADSCAGYHWTARTSLSPYKLCYHKHARRPAQHPSCNYRAQRVLPLARWGPTSYETPFTYPGEFRFNLSEYTVVLDKPLGISIAPDPTTGQIVVQHIEPGSSAEASKLVQVGDVLKWCSAVVGEGLWECTDMQHTKWALSNRNGQVKLILERKPNASSGPPRWCCAGKSGSSSCRAEVLQLPAKFLAAAAPPAAAAKGSRSDSWSDTSRVNLGRVMMVGFHRSSEASTVKLPRSGLMARQERINALHEQLAAARQCPEIDLSMPISRGSRQARPAQPGPPAAAAQAPAGFQQALSSIAQMISSSSSAAATAEAPVGSSSIEQAVASTGAAAQVLSGQHRAAASSGVRVVQLLPGLLISSGRLNTVALTRLATQLALSSIVELGLQVGPQGYLAIRAAEEQPEVECREHALVLAAAAARRLVGRRALRTSQRPCQASQQVVLLHCQEGCGADVALMLAGGLHWYGGMSVDEAAAAVEAAMGQPVRGACSWCSDSCCGAQWCVSAGVQVAREGVRGATAWLLARAQERSSRVVVSWPYGGLSVDVSGDLVGGWGCRRELRRCNSIHGCKGTHRGHYFLELRGLKPGRYHYKFIVDGSWALDPFAPKALDQSGNWNNILAVHQPPVIASEEDGLHFARLEAAHLALESKIGLPPY